MLKTLGCFGLHPGLLTHSEVLGNSVGPCDIVDFVCEHIRIPVSHHAVMSTVATWHGKIIIQRAGLLDVE